MSEVKDLTDIKKSLIAEINKRVEDKVLQPKNAKLLEKLINNADSDTEAINIAALGTTYKRTGLHFEKRLEDFSSDIHYFKKNEDLSFFTEENKPVNKLIIGDNYHALQNLLIQYKGKIDVIYIDPPYGKDSMGEFAQTNYQNAITRDNLLSMLQPRLFLAKELLSDNGVIFCSIDDRNQAYIKCLFDEVFGEINFICNISCISNPGGDKGDFIENTLQYVLVYCRCKDLLSDLGNYEKQNKSDYRQQDDYGYYKKGSQLEKWGNDDTTHTHPNLAYSIYYHPKNKDVECLFDYNQQEINDNRLLNIKYDNPDNALIKKGYFCIRPRITNTGENGRWRLEKNTFMERFKLDNFIFELQDEGVYKIYEKDRFEEYKFKKAKNFIPAEIAKQNTKELLSIFEKKVFEYVKPLPLIEYLVSLVNENLPSNRDSIILDFFAGSGTTGHAVLELNKKDGGNRQFILCQLNEKTDTTPNGIAYDVTSKRLKRIMTGECYDGTKDFKWIKDNEKYGGNLDVYELETVNNKETTAGKSAFEVIDETLYGKKKFETLKEKIDWVCQNFYRTQAIVKSDEEWMEQIKNKENKCYRK